MRELVLGAMPPKATEKTHIASGPWCFSGQEALFPGWDEGLFPFLPDPFVYTAATDSPQSIDAAARAANGEVLRLFTTLGQEMNQHFGVTYSSRFWTMALGPWLLLAVHMLAERQKRMQDIIARYKDEPLLVQMLPEETSFSFESSLDFMLHGVQDRAYNHYVFSRMLEKMAPPHWQCVPAEGPLPQHPPAPVPYPASGLDTLMRRITHSVHQARGAAATMLRQLPFPRQKGFSLPACLLLSAAVLANRNRQASQDRLIDFSAYCDAPLPWQFDAEQLIRKALPKALCNGLPPVFGRKGRLRGMTAAISQDDVYRLDLAAWLEGGGRLFSVQHGANYGNLRCIGGIIFEYSQHAFLSWGWQQHDHYPCNAVPLPHPALCAMAKQGISEAEWKQSLKNMSGLTRPARPEPDQPATANLPATPDPRIKGETLSAEKPGAAESQKGTNPPPTPSGTGTESSGTDASMGTESSGTGNAALILVGTEMSLYSYRLKSRALAGKQLAYRQRKRAFLKALPVEIQKNTLYRPYFTVKNGLEDARYVLEEMPHCNECKGDLTAHLFKSKLVMLDHYGTTLHMALAANIPVLCFWDPEDWVMEPASAAAVTTLQAGGIYYSDPQKAAHAVAALWEDPENWWHSEAVQKARLAWVNAYALCETKDQTPLALWMRALRSL